MNDAKGKGPAKAGEDETDATLDPSSQVPSSMLERVIASTTGLGRSAFAAPSSSELSDTSRALASSGKGQRASESSGTTAAESSKGQLQGAVPTLAGQPLPSFRTGHKDEHVQRTEAEFSSFLDGIDSFTPSQPIETESLPSGDLFERRAFRADGNFSEAMNQGYNTVEEQKNHDGQDVINILSDPEVMAEPLAQESVNAEEAVNWNLTQEQLMVLRGMMNELFPPANGHKSPGPDNILNLIPSAASLSNKEERLTWMEQWNGVLTRYTDEVWGDLLPLVKDAREEVQAIKDDPMGAIADQPKALRRLGLVLGHLKEPVI